MRAVVAGLTATNAIVAAGSLITGPLLAQALGASGRGDLAAILVPLGLLPPVLGLGIPAYIYRELPRGRTPSLILGSLAVPLVAIGVIAALLAAPAAAALAGGREMVRIFLLIGLAAMPVWLVGRLFQPGLASLERWRRVIATTLIPFAVSLVVVGTGYLTGRLTVALAAAAGLVGTLLALAPGVSLLWEGGRPRFDRRVARDGVAFGAKSWVGGIALLLNARLDQFVMISAVSPRELGLYAVAASVAGASNVFTSAVWPPLMTRVGAGHTHLLAPALRATLLATLAINALIALVTPVILPLLFGPAFHEAVAMTLVLLVGNVFTAGCGVLSAGLQGAGMPLVPSAAEGGAVAITAVGLLLLLGPLGGLGAAIVSVCAYGTSFVIQLFVSRRRFQHPVNSEPVIW
jgi:O-antigen/teichoic acid export membrane protein